jgi:hypothetical protein
MKNTVNFFSYVASDDNEMMAAIFGRKNIDHENAVLQDYELCIQTAQNVIDKVLPACSLPISPRAILTKKRGPEFELYTIRPKKDKNILGTIWYVTQEEYEYLRNYELIDCGMSEDIAATAITEKGIKIEVQTYGLKTNVDNITKVVEQNYVRKEIPSKEKIKSAIRIREEFIKSRNN